MIRDPKPVAALVATWREQASSLAGYADPVAKAFADVADQLEAALQAEAADSLSLTEAARVGGYSADHLGRLIRAGQIPNVGTKTRPRIRAAEVPRKATTTTGTLAPGSLRCDIGGSTRSNTSTSVRRSP